MIPVRSRERQPRYRPYKTLKAAEDLARRFGVRHVDLDGRVDIGNVVNAGLALAYSRSLPIPQEIKVRPFNEPDDVPDEAAYYLPGVATIEINSDHEAWVDVVATMKEAGDSKEISTSDARHVILHELGEYAMHRSVGDTRFNPFSEEYAADEEAFQAADLALVFDVLGDRATASHSEFVAEMVAAMQLGRARELKDNGELMQMYERFGGAEIRKYDRGLGGA
jgi:hypothetical protein